MVMPIAGEQYLRNQLSKDRHRDTLEDIFKHFENHLLQGISHIEAYPDMHAPAVPVSDSKPYDLETRLGNNYRRILQRTANTFLSLPTGGGKVKQTFNVGGNLCMNLKNNMQIC